MHFTFTHPMHTHPYNPELVTGKAVAEMAAAAEAAGFDGFGFTDHPAPSERWLQAGGHDTLDPFVAMGFAAARTTSISLIPNVVVLPYRNPFVVAKASATLDMLSGGRFVLAVGVGYLKPEFAALAVDFNERASVFEESLEVIRAIWSGDNISYVGEHFQATGITAHPRPEVAPPIWIGGNTKASRRRVVKYGHGWCPFAASAMLAQAVRTTPMDSLEALEAGIIDLHRRCEQAERDPATIDVMFNAIEGGTPGLGDFRPEVYLSGVDALAAIGVTWVQVMVPGDSLAHALDAIEQFGREVIAPAPYEH